MPRSTGDESLLKMEPFSAGMVVAVLSKMDGNCFVLLFFSDIMLTDGHV